MNDITAVVLSPEAAHREWPGLEVVVRQQVFSDAAGMQAARFDAIEHVRTPYFFFIDDDDELPADYLDVLADCRAVCSPIAYTDEEIVSEDGQRSVITSGPYSREAHYRNAMMLHHLVLCETAAALDAVARLPRGHYWPEFMLYWELARAGAGYVPRVGYVWHKRAGRLNTLPWAAVSQTRARLLFRDEYMALHGPV